VAATTVLAATVCAPSTPRDGWIAIEAGIIQEIGQGRPPRGATELRDCILTPGFVDLQINGVGDVDFSTASPSSLRRACDVLAQHGITSFCPTLISAPLTEYDARLTRIETARRDSAERPGSPTIVGVHLEGPFLGGAPGAHSPELLRTADVDWLQELMTSHPGVVRIVTLAPEADPDFHATKLLHEAGVVVALGHSDASFELATAAANAGASLVTHLFNGMSSFHHRAPGLSGAALDDDRLTPTVIADLVHVHAAVLRLAFARKSNIALVSDVVSMPTGAPTSDAVRLADGRLAGATALLDRALANVVSLGISLERAVSMASTVPTNVLGLADRGTLAAGCRADVVALDADTLSVRDVWIAGSRVVEADAT
jgi:N-acetylglucosamine-6-phosphate deacetylase